MTVELRERAARAGLIAGTPVALLAVLAGMSPLPTELVLVGLLGVLAAYAAARRPTAALLLAVVVASLLPYYAGRYVVGAVGLSPLGAACLVLLPAAFAARGRIRWEWLDTAVTCFVLLRVLSALVNADGPAGAAASVLLTTALPYAVFRALSTRPGTPRLLALAVVGCATPLAVLGVFERNGLANPYFSLVRPELEGAQWARAELRSSGVRAEASFGHPIAFGMFLALALVLAVVLALTVQSALRRAVLVAACGALLLGLTATLSRGPLLVAILGVAGWLLVHALRVNVLRLAAVGFAVMLVAITTPVLGTLESLQRSSIGDTAEARSAQYRLQVLAVVRDPAQFSLLGLPVEGRSVSEAVNRRTGLKSIDSELAVVHLTSGALALVALVGIGALVIRVAARPGLPPLESAWAVALAASFLNLLTVALLTQYRELFWAAVAVVAGIAQRHVLARTDPDR